MIVHLPGSFRTGNIDNDDCHLAFRTEDFDGALATLTAHGFRDDAAEEDPMRVMVLRNGLGFPQLYLLDPRPQHHRDQRRAVAMPRLLARLDAEQGTYPIRTRVATRYDKLAANYLAFIQLASIRLWLRANESMPKLKLFRSSAKRRPQRSRKGAEKRKGQRRCT